MVPDPYRILFHEKKEKRFSVLAAQKEMKTRKED
jgi:hypothetical protein